MNEKNLKHFLYFRFQTTMAKNPKPKRKCIEYKREFPMFHFIQTLEATQFPPEQCTMHIVHLIYSSLHKRLEGRRQARSMKKKIKVKGNIDTVEKQIMPIG